MESGLTPTATLPKCPMWTREGYGPLSAPLGKPAFCRLPAHYVSGLESVWWGNSLAGSNPALSVRRVTSI